MKLFLIHDGATLKGWTLEEGVYLLGQAPSVDLRLAHPLCPDVLCRIEVDTWKGRSHGDGARSERRAQARFTINEMGEAKLVCPDGKTSRGVLYNGGSLTVGPFILQAHEVIQPPPFFVGESPFGRVPTEPAQGILPPQAPLILVVHAGKISRPVELRDGMKLGRDPRIGEKEGIHFENRMVSEEHATIEERQGGFYITNLSKQGTWLGEVELERNESKRLVDGMVIRVSKNPLVPTIEVRAAADLLKRPVQRLAEASMIGDSEPMRKLRARAVQLAQGRAAIRLFGETGTGKGLLARFIAFHAKQKLVHLDCTTITPQLAEDYLFGHAKGAFTDAKVEQPGIIDEANGGILLIDEIGDLPLALQPKLLRLLEEHKYRRVGGDKDLHADFRVIVATHRDIDQMVADRTFRPDLWNRISGNDLTVPPLRDRMEDIALIAAFFLDTRDEEQRRTLSAAALAALHGSKWPGNVRQLTHLLDAAADLTSEGDEIAEATVRELMAKGVGQPQPREDLHFVDNAPARVAEYERSLMAEGLRRAKGQVKVAARQLGYKSVNTFRRRALEWGLLPRKAGKALAE
jgi:DNA-binding NtrC family response regulator